MRFILLFLTGLLCFLPTAHAMDWKTLGTPVEDDTKAMRDRYVYFGASTTDKNISLDKPGLVNTELREWLLQRIAEVLELNGAGYEQQIIVNRRHFTAKGYGEYVASLQAAKIPALLKQQHYTMSAIVLDPPNIVANGLRDEGGDKAAKTYRRKLVYIWKVQAPILLNYRDMAASSNYKIYLDVELTRIPMQTNNNDALVAINGWRFSSRPFQSPP